MKDELYLSRADVRALLISQPDENLDITEAILFDIDQLQVHTAEGIRTAAPETMQPEKLRCEMCAGSKWKDACPECNGTGWYVPDPPQSAATTIEPVAHELEEDDPHVLAVARSIAEKGFGRPWSDFLPLNALDTDQSDLVEYAKAAIAAAPSTASSADAVREQAFKTAEMLESAVLFDRPYRDFLAKQLRAALSAPVAGEWQDISSAPKDREILAVRIEWWQPENGNHRWIHSQVRQTKWDTERQRFGFNHEKQPTHWTEVPAIPALPIPRNDRQTGEPQS